MRTAMFYPDVSWFHISEPDFGGNCRWFRSISPPCRFSPRWLCMETGRQLCSLCVHNAFHSTWCIFRGAVRPPLVMEQIRQGQVELLPWRQGYTEGTVWCCLVSQRGVSEWSLFSGR